jgi:hypothetical protein
MEGSGVLGLKVQQRVRPVGEMAVVPEGNQKQGPCF